MPVSRNPFFVGHTADLQTIARELTTQPTAGVIPTVVLSGIPGIGKTQLASEFVFRYGRYFRGGVFWLNFTDAAGILAEMAACGEAGKLGVPRHAQALSVADRVALVLAAWQSDLPRLLIFDNCEEPDLITQWRPTSGGCRVLVTARRGVWDRDLGFYALALGFLDRPDSLTLLHHGRDDLLEAEADLNDIADELQDLPLALHLAASFLLTYRHRYTPAQYLAQLRAGPRLDHPSFQEQGRLPTTGHAKHIADSFRVSYGQLDPNDPIDRQALALLARAAFLAPGVPIPRNFLPTTLQPSLRKLLDRLLARLNRTRRNLLELEAEIHTEQALTRLVALGLLERNAQGDVRLHRLIGDFVRAVTTDHNAQAAVERVLLDRANQLNEAGYPGPLLPLQPHLRAVTEAAIPRQDARAHLLCAALGYYLWQAGDYDGAYTYYLHSLTISHVVYGAQHPATALSLSTLAGVLQDQGDLPTARQYLEQALAILRRTLGVQHPATASSLSTLAMVFHDQGDLPAARRYVEQALAIRYIVLGEQHPATASSLNHLAMVFHDEGDLPTARQYHEQALAIRRTALGEQHPATANSLNNLAGVLQDQGDLPTARQYLEQALAILRTTHGEQHPKTQLVQRRLTRLLRSQPGDLT